MEMHGDVHSHRDSSSSFPHVHVLFFAKLRNEEKFQQPQVKMRNVLPVDKEPPKIKKMQANTAFDTKEIIMFTSNFTPHLVVVIVAVAVHPFNPVQNMLPL